MKKTKKPSSKATKKAAKAAPLCSRAILKEIKKELSQKEALRSKPHLLVKGPEKLLDVLRPILEARQVNFTLEATKPPYKAVARKDEAPTVEKELSPIEDVADLRKKGFKVRVTYLRPVSRKEFSQKGGLTQVNIRTPQGKELFGESRCSWQDQFCYRTGRQLAVKRALADYFGT